MPPKQDAHAKKVEDKTFGMKNKNKSKVVQKQIAQMKSSRGGEDEFDKRKKQEKQAAAQALDMVLFKEAKKKNEIRKAAEMACMAKPKEKVPEKRDIHVDTREQKEKDLMENWDEEKLRSVIEQKRKGGQGERVKSDIVCKHFLDAIEQKRYGWFWECPNGGDKCQYRHALPPGYVLKSEVKEEEVQETRLEDEIETKRRALTTRTPVTLERLQVWLKEKQDRKAKEEETKLEDAKKEYAKGKRPVMSGRALFAIDPTLFIDDEGADEGAIEFEDEDSDDDERQAVDLAPVSRPLDEEPAEDEGEGGAEGAEGEGGAAADGAAEDDRGAEGEAAAEAEAAAPAVAAGASAPSSAAAGSSEEVSRPAGDVADLDGVDESLFLGEDFDDADIE